MRIWLLLVLLVCGCGAPRLAYRGVSWRELSEVPSALRTLDGQRLRLNGYVVPLEMEGQRIQSFLLVRDQMLCCFGKMPALHEWVFVEFPRGAGLELQSDRPVEVSGRLWAREEREKGVVTSLYRMEAEKVQVLEGTPPGWKAH